MGGVSFPHLFELQASATPDGVAIVCDGQALTYAELNTRANRMAGKLAKAGLQRGSVVAGVLERSPELVVFILGTLKAGGCCLPIDSEYPAERIALILDDAKPEYVMSDHPISTAIPRIDISDAGDGEMRDANPDIHIGESDPSFLLYTSGSMGRPKGVVMTHGGRARRQIWTQARYQATASDRHLLKSPIGFGTLIREIFWPLTTGGRMVIAGPGRHRDVDHLCRLIRTEHMSIANFVPSLLREFLEHPAVGQCRSLRHVFSTGEALAGAVATRLEEQLPHARLHLFYGSSEAPTATYKDFDGGTIGGMPTIGYPASVPVYVLDEQLEPLLDGSVGEIFIGGDGLASGYHRQPELTAARFLPDRFLNNGSARMFRTGDLGRWESDGSLTYLGRADEQVKIRGCRVELSEVAAAIRAQAEVADAAAIACDGPGDTKQIVAFYVPQTGIEWHEIAKRLEQSLPWFMVPSRLLAIERLPRDAHGKVDRTALRHEAQRYAVNGGTDCSLLTDAEHRVIDIWRRVLKCGGVGIDDSFFELGGDSILALRTISAIRQATGVQLSVEQFFVARTPKQIAALLAVETIGEGEARAGTALRSRLSRLSSAQKRLWFLESTGTAGRAYNVCVAYRLAANANAGALKHKLNLIVTAQEALRSKVELMDGESWQTFPPGAPVELPVDPGTQDLSGWLSVFSKQLLVLDAPPHLKAALYRDARSGDVLALLLPHFACDRRSIRILETSLFGPGDVESGSYSGFCDDEQTWLAGDAARKASESWRRRLEGYRDIAEIPGILPLTETVKRADYSSAAAVTHVLPDDVMTRVEEIAVSEECTPFTVLWAALAVFIGRMARTGDVVIGVPVDGRRADAHAGTIGNFINIVPLRLRLGDVPFHELLRDATAVLAHALSNTAVPFEQIVEQLRPRRRNGRNPLFEISLNFDPTPQRLLSWESASVKKFEVPPAGAKVDLNFYILRSAGRWQIRLVYRSVLYERAWIEGVLEGFQTLLQQITINSSLRIGDYSTVSVGFRRFVPDLAVPIEEPAYEQVWTRFERIAAMNPHTIAIDAHSAGQINRSRMTYAELADAAAEIGDRFSAAGVRAGDRIAIRTTPSMELVVTMLAVWRMQAVFLLLDERLPEKRLRAMLEQGSAGWLWQGETQTLMAVPSADTPGLPITSGQTRARQTPACIFFTSGSSGPPKAVCFSHEGISHFLSWERTTLGITAEDRVPLLLSMSFDAILRDIFLPLTSGATLCLPVGNVTPEWISDSQVTVLHLVPAMAKAWIAGRAQPLRFRHLRWAIFSGEPLTGILVERWREAFGREAKVVNLYGPTETTMCKCFYVVPEEVSPGPLPVGNAMTDTQIFVMSEASVPCGMGEQGEIVIRTPFRTMGYLNAPDLNEARFVRNPQRPADREDLLYLTGDIGRLRHDGALEVLGREDRQVKIRGARVEPQEVEALIGARPDVAQCAVVAPVDVHGDRCLVAYVVPGANRTDLPADLNDYLREQLPPYAVPAAFHLLERLPTTPTGKVDYASLASREHEQPPTTRAITHATSPLELQLTRIWEDLLTVSPIGIDDDFFDLGGHSLLAVQLMARIESICGKTLPLSSLFPTATIRRLARQMLRDSDASEWNPVVVIQSGGMRSPLFCVHPAGGSVFCYVHLARCIGRGQSVFGLQGADPRRGAEPANSVTQMAAEYFACIRRTQPNGPYTLAGFSFGGLIAYETARHLQEAGETVSLLVLLDTRFPRSGEQGTEASLVHHLYQVLARHSLADRDPDEDDAALWRELTALARRYTGPALGEDQKGRGRGALGLAQTCFRDYGLLPTGADLSYLDLRRYLRFLRKNLQIARDYSPTPISSPVLFVGGSERMPGEEVMLDRAAPWRSLCTGGFETLAAPGNHTSLLSPPGVDIIALRLKSLLR